MFVACFVVALLSRGAAGLWSTVGTTICPASFLAFFAMAGWCWVTGAIHRARSAPYLREFLRRHAVAETPTNGAATAGVERIVVVVTGRGLPHGGGRAVWVAVSRGATPQGTIVHASTPGEHDKRGTNVGEAVLSPASSQEISAAIDAAMAATELPKLDTVRDGFPFGVTIHRSGAPKPLNLGGNLCARNWREHAGARLADLVFRAADAVGAAQQPYGACNSRGDVTIGDR